MVAQIKEKIDSDHTAKPRNYKVLVEKLLL